MTINIGRRFITTLVALLVVVGVGVGAYLYGQSTRQSESDVASRVNKAVAERSDQAEVDQALAVKRAEHAQRIADRKKWTKRMDKAVTKAREEGYSSGNAAGYSSGSAAGYSSGVDDGLVQGSDELTCSDDSDVPLPACNLFGY